MGGSSVTYATVSVQPLSLTQRYFHDQILEEGFDPTWQHVQIGVNIARVLEPGVVADAAPRLEQRHTLLATRLAYHQGEPVLVHSAASDRAVTMVDLRGARREEVDLWISGRVDQPFDLLHGPLWRLIVARCDGGRTVVHFTCHHLVADGVSTWLLLKDFGVLCFGGELDAAGEPYEAFVAGEQEMLAGPEGEQRLTYWAGALDGAQARLSIDEAARLRRLGAGEILGLQFDPGTGEAVVRGARERRVMPLALLAGATCSAVKRAVGEDDVLLAVVTDTRGGRFMRTVGTFSDLLLIRDPPGDGDGDERARFANLRNAFFNGWKSHLPVGHLRRHLPNLQTAGSVALNPSDVFLNFVPVKTSSDWWNLIAPYDDATLEHYVPGARTASPSRRMLAPLFFFTLVHAADLGGAIAVHAREELHELNRDVVRQMQTEIAALAPLEAAPAG